MNKVLSRTVLAKLIASPEAVCFSATKNRNVKEPVDISPSDKELEVSRREMVVLDIS
jgi:hypothetical protein